MKPDALLETWTSLTGEKWRLVPLLVMQQASEFVTAGFTVEELTMVVQYVKRMIARNEGGYTAQSLLWRVMAEDNWQKFQERLELAQNSKKRFKKSPERQESPEQYDPETIRRQIEGNREFRQRLIRGQ